MAPAARAAYPAGLTGRELEVLQLVAQGLTDAQVADRLIISRRTVSTHLSAIYGQIQVSSRSAATRFAIEHELARGRCASRWRRLRRTAPARCQ